MPQTTFMRTIEQAAVVERRAHRKLFGTESTQIFQALRLHRDDIVGSNALATWAVNPGIETHSPN